MKQVSFESNLIEEKKILFNKKFLKNNVNLTHIFLYFNLNIF